MMSVNYLFRVAQRQLRELITKSDLRYMRRLLESASIDPERIGTVIVPGEIVRTLSIFLGDDKPLDIQAEKVGGVIRRIPISVREELLAALDKEMEMDCTPIPPYTTAVLIDGNVDSAPAKVCICGSSMTCRGRSPLGFDYVYTCDRTGRRWNLNENDSLERKGGELND